MSYQVEMGVVSMQKNVMIRPEPIADIIGQHSRPCCIAPNDSGDAKGAILLPNFLHSPPQKKSFSYAYAIFDVYAYLDFKPPFYFLARRPCILNVSCILI
jgi:hypothetical protein